MICGRCGNDMVQGEFAMQNEKSAFLSPNAVFFENENMICEAVGSSTLGYYCPECGMMIGVFPITRPLGFAGKYQRDFDDKVDRLPKKSCPECGSEIDVDYPRCPFCGHLYEVI